MSKDMPQTRRLSDLYLIRYLLKKPHILIAMAAGLATYAAVSLLTPLQIFPCILVGWNAFTALYLAMAWSFMRRADQEAIRSHAGLYDDGEFAVLLLSIAAAILSVAAIICTLAPSPDLNPQDKTLHILLSGLTLASSWTFIHTAFAFHYAHGFYFPPDHEKKPPLLFPGSTKPNYMDFLYFSFVIGTSGQTADVDLASTEMRRIGLLHCIVAYLFNAAVLGLSINIAAGIISGK